MIVINAGWDIYFFQNTQLCAECEENTSLIKEHARYHPIKPH